MKASLALGEESASLFCDEGDLSNAIVSENESESGESDLCAQSERVTYHSSGYDVNESASASESVSASASGGAGRESDVDVDDSLDAYFGHGAYAHGSLQSSCGTLQQACVRQACSQGQKKPH